MLFGLLRSKSKKEKHSQRTKVYETKTGIKKYFDSDYNLYRYARTESRIDKYDTKCYSTTTCHTIPVSKNISFEQASAKSFSFTNGLCPRNISSKYERDHYSVINEEDWDVRGYYSKYVFEDNSKYIIQVTSRQSEDRIIFEQIRKEELRDAIKDLLLLPLYMVKWLLGMHKQK